MSTAAAPTPTVPSQNYPALLTGANPTDTTQHAPRQQHQPRVVSHPQEVLHLVLRQMEVVMTRKDEFTMALKGLTDLTKQLVQAYAAHTRTIAALQMRVKTLEVQVGQSAQITVGNDGIPQNRV